jgi:putative GTP pyrophosphokinase
MNTVLKEGYDKRHATYSRLKTNIEEALGIYLSEDGISSLAIYGRVKSFDSFLEKIERKDYEDPFVQTEDMVGVRVILYYPQDIERVAKIILSNFNVKQSEDKASKLKANEFGYRSHHFIVKPKKEWCVTPNYKGLENIKAEIQVRTVLMHAWAEIEHKLQYKNKDQVPAKLQRKIFLLSAKFEEADVQFEELRDRIEKYSEEISEKLRQSGAFPVDVELNMNSFREFLKFYYPKNAPHEKLAESEFEQVQKNNLGFKELSETVKAFRPLESFVNKELPYLAQPAMLGYALEVTRDDFKKKYVSSEGRKIFVAYLRSLFKEQQPD